MFHQHDSKRFSLFLFIAIAVVTLIAFPTRSARLETQPAVAMPPAEDLKFYFGNLHAHTAYSDGTGTPAEAFRYAKEIGKLDFMAVTEHNHVRAEGTGFDPEKLHIAKDSSLYEKLKNDANNANKNDVFVAIYGQEFSTMAKGGNHTNSFMTNKRITTKNGDYKRVFTNEWMTEYKVCCIQFNHPWEAGVPSNKISTPADVNYGFNKYPNRAAFVQAVDNRVVAIEVVNGPGTKDPTSGQVLNSKADPSYYFRYLNMGLHIAPTADQDNHFRTWGTLTPARTVVLAPRLTRDNILDALKRRRVYASQDNDLKVGFKLNGEVMGSRLSALGVGEPAEISIRIDDGGAATNTYLVKIYYDDRPGYGLAKLIDQGTTANHKTITFSHTPKAGKGYYFTEVTITKGDNKGKRAWTAPIWLE